MSGYTSIIDATPAFVAGTFDAKDVRLAAIGNALPGLFASGHLAVTQRAAGANQSVDVGAGQCFVDPGTVAYQGAYVVRNDASYNTFANGGYTWTASDATNPRIDLLCVEVADTDFSGSYTGWKLRIVDGTPNASAAHALDAQYWPSVPTGCVPLAAIRRAANATTIVTADIANLNPIGGVGRSATRYTAATETTTSATAARLATPDALLVYVPSTSSRVRVAFKAHWKISVASGSQLAYLYMDGAGIKTPAVGGVSSGNVGVQVTSLPTLYSHLATSPAIQTSGSEAGMDSTNATGSDVSDAAGAQIMGSGPIGSTIPSAGPVELFGMAVGWHLLELLFATTANTLSVRERRMQAEVIG